MIRVALVGVSGYGRCYLDAVRELEDLGHVKLVAACIVNHREEAALWNKLSRQGVRCFEETGAMWCAMRGMIDLTLLPTPPHTHSQLALEAFSAGSHVLVEKPLAASVAEAREMVAGASGASRRLFVGFQDLYSKNTWKLKRELLRGRFGEVSSVSFLGLWPRPASYYSRNAWAGKLKLGDQLVNDTPVSNAFAHFLNLCLFFAGPDEAASAAGVEIEAELLRANDIETFDTAALRIKTDTGIPVHFFCSHTCEKNVTPTIRIVSESARIHWKHEDGIFVEGGKHENFSDLSVGLDTRTEMLANITKVLGGKPADICTADIALAPLAVSERLQEFRVLPVSRSRRQRIAMPEDSLVCVNGLADTLNRCFETGLLPSELSDREIAPNLKTALG